MKTTLITTAILLITLVSCKKDVIEEKPPVITPETNRVVPVDITIEGFDFLDKMQGHWVGSNKIMADDWDWFTFDYRAIESSIVHGIFEGGSMGNLFTTFFVSNYKGTKTIMARNGGVLNGIYRTSYFVMDKVTTDADGDFYRLVDAIGGTDVMWMELRFTGDSLYYNVYTSRLGLLEPTRHMTFKANKINPELANQAAITYSFPQNTIYNNEWDFTNGFDPDYLYKNAGDTAAKSATFMWQDQNADVLSLAISAGDPIRIDQYPSLSTLDVNISRNTDIQDKNLFLLLSEEPLTDNNGALTTNPENYNSILLFPYLNQGESSFQFTYLHPGDYYITVIADVNEDFNFGAGDVTHAKQMITILPNATQQVTINDINVQN